jgi:arylsulfatase A-like enzyme
MSLAACCVAVAIAAAACGTAGRPAPPPAGSPNILWIVWDTVRADHLGLYGYGKSTTPFLDRWARSARVYENCVSAAPYTVASHASMFTGLLPTEHGASNSRPYLDARLATVAELLRARGYQTYLYSANPHISRAEGFHRGFDAEEHPWDARYRDEAYSIVAGKIAPEDASSELSGKIRAKDLKGEGWDVKASGELAQRGVEAWLDKRDRRRPFFVFMNYMEAHRPWIPSGAQRRRTMTADEIDRSYRIDRSWLPLWSYTFGLHEYDDADLAVMAATYDACLGDLDDLLRRLMDSLAGKGLLDDTLVVVTSDHGEHLGEHHILDHQYSLYEPLLRVPLVIRDPKRFAPGRDARPVMNLDLFPTLLEAAGAEAPPATRGVSLLAPREERVRVAECTGVFSDPFSAVAPVHPAWNPAPWEREIRAVYGKREKLIRWSDGRLEMYAVREDPAERADLAPAQSERARAMETALASFVATLRPAGTTAFAPPPMSAEQRDLLRSLGYVHDGDPKAGRRAP